MMYARRRLWETSAVRSPCMFSWRATARVTNPERSYLNWFRSSVRAAGILFVIKHCRRSETFWHICQDLSVGGNHEWDSDFVGNQFENYTFQKGFQSIKTSSLVGASAELYTRDPFHVQKPVHVMFQELHYYWARIITNLNSSNDIRHHKYSVSWVWPVYENALVQV